MDIYYVKPLKPLKPSEENESMKSKAEELVFFLIKIYNDLKQQLITNIEKIDIKLDDKQIKEIKFIARSFIDIIIILCRKFNHEQMEMLNFSFHQIWISTEDFIIDDSHEKGRMKYLACSRLGFSKTRALFSGKLFSDWPRVFCENSGLTDGYVLSMVKQILHTYATKVSPNIYNLLLKFNQF